MKNTQGVYFRQRSILTAVLLLMSFVGVANASLSGIPPGYPRFISTDNLFYDKNGTTGVVSFNSDSVKWQTLGAYPEDVINASFDVNVNLANLSNPVVTAGSSISIFGEIASLGTGVVSLFTADITSIGWTTGTGAIIEFVMNQDSMAGAVCDLGYCSTFHDEVLQFTLDKNFSGKWRRNFKRSALAVATVPVPAAVWLMGSALVGLVGVGRRKQAV